MAQKEWNSNISAKWATANKWTPEGAPAATEDAKFVAAHAGECKVETAIRTCRSLIMTGYTGTLNIQSFPLEIGSATTSEIEENVACRLAGSITSALESGEIIFVSTITTTPQKIFTGGKQLKNIKIVFNKAGVYQLEEALKISGTAARPVNLSAGELKANSQIIEVAAAGLNVSGTASIDLSGATVIGLGGAEGWNWSSSGTLTTTAGTVFEVGGPAAERSQFGGGGKTYEGTVKILAAEAVIDSAAGQTIKTLEVLAKAPGPLTTGSKFKEAAKTIFTNLTFGGVKAGERTRIESSVAAKPHKFEKNGGGDYEPANSWVSVKDFTYEGGVLYLPNGEDLGGNTNIKFEAKPAGVVTGKASGTLLLAGSATATVSSVVTGKAAGALLLTGTATGTLRSIVVGKASGAVLLPGTATATIRSVIAAKATGTLLLTGTSKGSIAGAVQGKASGVLTLTGTSAATVRAVVLGKAVGPLTLTGTATGQRISRVTGSAAGPLLLTGTAKGTISGNITGKATGALIFTGSAHAEPLIPPPHYPGITDPRQAIGLSAPSRLVGVTSPTQRSGDA